MDFLEKLDDLMSREKLNKSTLSKASGIPYTTIDGWYKKGYEGLKISTLKRLSECFGTSLDYWFGDGEGVAMELMGSEREFIVKYRLLDGHGRRMVDFALDEEYARAEKERQARAASTGELRRTKVIRLFRTPAAAGVGEPIQDEDFDEIVVSADKEGDFAVRIQGDSMEPYIRDGGIVYVDADGRFNMQNGDVGIFFFNGDTYCKQFNRDRLGNVILFSVNRERADRDVFVMQQPGLECFGKVIMDVKPPMPR